MTIVSILFVHGIILLFALRSMRKKSRKPEVLLFVSLMLFSAYTGISKPASLPQPPLAKGLDFIFQPVGKWIERILGGKSA